MNDLLHRWNSLIHKEDVCHRYFKFVLQCPEQMSLACFSTSAETKCSRRILS